MSSRWKCSPLGPSWAAVLALWILGLLCPPATAAADEIEEAREAAREELVEGLEGLAAWCTRKKIYLQRVSVYESILHFDPGNTTAMRGLGYIKDRNGNWKETERKVEPKDWSQGAVRQFPARRSAVVEAYRDAMFGLFETYKGRLSPTQSERILDDILEADPDDARVRELRGEAKLDGRWVLRETLVAKEGREILRDRVRQAFKTAPKAREVEANKRELAYGIAWKAVYATEHVRSLGTGTAKEVERMTTATWAARSLFNGALGVQAKYPRDFAVYTLARPADKMAFLMNHPAVDQSYRDFLFQLEGSGIQGSGDLAHWADDKNRRLDGLVRQSIMWLFADGYQIYPTHGWIFEGFGLYLTRELVGTRLSWFVKPSQYLVEEDDLALQARLLDSRTNWMNEALQVLEHESRPKLQFLLGKDVNAMTTEDLLYAYVLAAYLLEAQAESIPRVFTRIGKGEPSTVVLEEELGLELADLDVRVRRWLSERR